MMYLKVCRWYLQKSQKPEMLMNKISIGWRYIYLPIHVSWQNQNKLCEIVKINCADEDTLCKFVQFYSSNNSTQNLGCMGAEFLWWLFSMKYTQSWSTPAVLGMLLLCLESAKYAFSLTMSPTDVQGLKRLLLMQIKIISELMILWIE